MKKDKERKDKSGHNISPYTTKIIMLTRAGLQTAPPRCSSSLPFSLPNKSQYLTSWHSSVVCPLFLWDWHLRVRSVFSGLEALLGGGISSTLKASSKIFPMLATDPACWPERWKLPRQRIDVCTASNLRSSSRFTSRTCKETERRRCGRSHSNAQVSDGITKY